MENTKRLKLSALFIFIMLLNFGIYAQQRGGGQRPPQMPDNSQIEKMVAEMSEQLSLTDNQAVELEALFKEHFSEMKSTMNSGNRPSRDEMDAMKSEFESKVKSILSDEQMAKFNEFMKENQNRGKGRR